MKKTKTSKAIAAILIMLIITMPANAVVITQITQTPLNSSMLIEWETDIPANSSLSYGNTTVLNRTIENTTLSTLHSMEITGIVPDITYYYNIKSCDSTTGCFEGGQRNFILPSGSQSGELTLELDSGLANLTNSTIFSLFGIAEVGTVIKVYINRQPGLLPVLIRHPDGTTSFDMSAEAGVFAGDIVLLPGRNVITLEARKGGLVKEITHTVTLDTIAPVVVLNDLPQMSSENGIAITGSVSELSTVRLLIDGGQSKMITGIDNLDFGLTQLGTIRDGQEAVFTVQLVAQDGAGNIGYSQSQQVRIDKKKPEIRYDEDYSQVKTHKALFSISGTTEPGSSVEVQNIRELSDITEFSGMSRDQIIQLDPLGIFFNKDTGTADQDGHFATLINLFEGRNRLAISATDLAGNTHMDYKDIVLETGAPQWQLVSVEPYPSSIYFDEMRMRPVRATIFLTLDWVGLGEAPSRVDMTNVEIDGSNKDNNKLVRMSVSKKHWDPRKKRLFALINVEVIQWSGTADTLFNILKESVPQVAFQKQLVVSFKATITETYESQVPRARQAGASAVVFHSASFAVQKPEDLSRFLSPELINNTLNDVIVPTKDFLKKAQTGLLYATGAGLLACGAMTVARIFGGAGLGDSTVYYVCDRVLCPSVPPSCSDTVFSPWQSNDTGAAFQVNEAAGKASTVRFIKFDPSSQTHLQAYPLCKAGQYVVDQTARETGSSTFEYKEVRKYNCISEDVYKNTADFYSSAGSSGFQALHDKYYDLTKTDANKAKRTIDLNKFTMGRCYTDGPPAYDDARCFGQSFDEWTNPRDDIIKSVRCGCLPGMYGFARSLYKITEGMEKCLRQVQIGAINGGLCERMFLAYFCDVATSLFGDVVKSYRGERDQGIVERSDVNGMVESAKKFKHDLEDRYGESFNSQTGLSSNKLVNSVCMFAFLGDLSLLEGAIEGFIKDKPVAPIFMVSGSSRQAGYDPFVGKMKVNYNIYVGIVPGGGTTDIELKLACDPRAEGSEYCIPGKEVPITQLPRSIGENSPPIDQNILFEADPADHWYNKVVLTLRYQLDPSGPYITKTESKTIKRYGDLAVRCVYSITGGINCPPVEIDEGGIAQLITIGEDQRDRDVTRISPDQTITYYPSNRVSLLAKIFNNYRETFYLHLDVTDPNNRKTELEYPIFPTAEELGEIQYYNLFVAQLPHASTTSSVSGSAAITSQDKGVSIIVEADGQTTESLVITLSDNLGTLGTCTAQDKILKPLVQDGAVLLSTQVQNLISNNKLKEYTSTVGQTVKKFYLDENGFVYTVAGVESTETLELLSGQTQGEVDDIENVRAQLRYEKRSDDYIECRIDNGFLSSERKIRSVNAAGGLATVHIHTLDDPKTKLATFFTRATTQVADVKDGEYRIIASLLKDTNNDAKGDTPIIYNTIEQKFDVAFRAEKDVPGCLARPNIEIVEPVLGVLPYGSSKIGANIVDDCNELSYIKVTLRKKGETKPECECKVVREDNDAFNFGSISDCSDSPSCLNFAKEFAPVRQLPAITGNNVFKSVPYYRFTLNLRGHVKDLTAEYEIEFEAADRRGDAERITKVRNVRFNQDVEAGNSMLANSGTDTTGSQPLRQAQDRARSLPKIQNQ